MISALAYRSARNLCTPCTPDIPPPTKRMDDMSFFNRVSSFPLSEMGIGLPSSSRGTAAAESFFESECDVDNMLIAIALSNGTNPGSSIVFSAASTELAISASSKTTFGRISQCYEANRNAPARHSTICISDFLVICRGTVEFALMQRECRHEVLSDHEYSIDQ